MSVSCENKLLGLPACKGPKEVNLPPSDQLIRQRIVPYWEFSTGLSFWQVGYLEMIVARSALLRICAKRPCISISVTVVPSFMCPSCFYSWFLRVCSKSNNKVFLKHKSDQFTHGQT